MSGARSSSRRCVCALIALISIFTVDQSIALAVHGSGYENAAFFDKGRRVAGYLHRAWTGRQPRRTWPVPAWRRLHRGRTRRFAIRRTSYGARVLIFTGAVQWVTIEAAWQIKEVFGRMRPFQLIEKNDWSPRLVHGQQFVSVGTQRVFLGLFVPLLYLYPALEVALLIVPVFIALARIDENYHFLSDVLASIALACLITVLAVALFKRWIDAKTPIGRPNRDANVGRFRALIGATHVDRRMRISGEAIQMSIKGNLFGAAIAARDVGCEPGVLAGDQDFTFVNHTGVEIHKLYTSPHSSDEWEEDVLGEDTLDDGESLEIRFRSARSPRTGISASKTARAMR